MVTLNAGLSRSAFDAGGSTETAGSTCVVTVFIGLISFILGDQNSSSSKGSQSLRNFILLREDIFRIGETIEAGVATCSAPPSRYHLLLLSKLVPRLRMTLLLCSALKDNTMIKSMKQRKLHLLVRWSGDAKEFSRGDSFMNFSWSASVRYASLLALKNSTG